jgi:hypothetical protein
MYLEQQNILHHLAANSSSEILKTVLEGLPKKTIHQLLNQQDKKSQKPVNYAKTRSTIKLMEGFAKENISTPHAHTAKNLKRKESEPKTKNNNKMEEDKPPKQNTRRKKKH